MASYLDFGFDTFLRVKIQKVGVIDAVYVPAISSDVVVDTSSIPVESISEVYLNNDGLKVKDTDATHGLTIQPGSNLTADRTLTVTTGDSNRTLTLNGDVVLPGGTLTPSNGGIVYSTDTALAVLAGTATAGQHLQSGASSAPSWTTATYPATTTANQLLYSSATNTITGLATAASSVLVTNGSSVPSLSTDIPTAVTIGTAYIYRASGTDVPVTDGGTGASDASTARSNLGLGSISTQASNNVSITGGSITSITDLAIADGGTGASTATSAFNSLSPISAQGDLIEGNSIGNSVRLARGSTGTVLMATASDISWSEALIVNRQDKTTNSTLTPRISSGWGFILGDGTYLMSKVITFPVAYSAVPVVVVCGIGALTGSDPGAINNLVTASPATNVTTEDISVDGFTVNIQRTSKDGTDPGGFGATTRYGFAWYAIGTR